MAQRVRYQAPPLERSLADRLIDACRAADFGRDLVAMRVKLRDPKATQKEIDDAVRVWLASDPPDDGVVIPWPRR
jgi:hypothetical protein